VPSFAPFTGGAPSKASMAMNSSAGGTPATAAGTHKLSDKFASPITNLSRRSWGVGGSLITNHWKSGSNYLCARSVISYGLSTIRLRPAGAGLRRTRQLFRPLRARPRSRPRPRAWSSSRACAWGSRWCRCGSCR
jgi:hypothetical protein